MQTPNITPAQTGAISAVLAAVIAALSAAPDRLQVPLVAAAAIVAVAWIIGDAIVRHGRARIEASRVAAVTDLPPDALDAALSVVTKLPPDHADGDDQAAHGAAS